MTENPLDIFNPAYFDRLRQLAKTEEELVQKLGRQIGYGRIMQLCEQLWAKDLKDKYNIEGGEKTSGPCAGLLVPCPCNGNSCDWCCGTHRVTKRVRKAMLKEKKR